MTLLLVQMTKEINSLILDQNLLENETTCSNGQFYSSLTWKYFKYRQICLTKALPWFWAQWAWAAFLLTESSLWTKPVSSSNSFLNLILETTHREEQPNLQDLTEVSKGPSQMVSGYPEDVQIIRAATELYYEEKICSRENARQKLYKIQKSIISFPEECLKSFCSPDFFSCFFFIFWTGLPPSFSSSHLSYLDVVTWPKLAYLD